MIKHLEKDFNEEIKGKKLLVDFYAEWCGPCKMLTIVLDQIKDIDILKVDVDKFPKVAQEYGVMSVPTLLLMEDGKILKQHIGFMSNEEVNQFIK